MREDNKKTADEKAKNIICKLMKFAKNGIKSSANSTLSETFNRNIAGNRFMQQAKRYRNRVILGTVIGATVITGGKKIFSNADKDEIKTEKSCADYNYKLVKANEDALILCLANGEDFSDEVYWEKSAYTQGYGNTERYGVKVKKGDRPISRTLSKEFLEMVNPDKPYMKNIKEGTFQKAQDYVQYHLEENVYPSLTKAVKVKLNRNQAIAVCVFIYNVGGSAFENSTFCKKLNEGKTGYDDCTKYITLYRYQTVQDKKTKKSKKVLASGLINRAYFTIALFNGDLPPESVLDHGIRSLYSYPRGKLCNNEKAPAGTCLELNLDDKTMSDFVDFCVNPKRFNKQTRHILPQKLVKAIENSEGYNFYLEQRKIYLDEKVQKTAMLSTSKKRGR